MVATSKKIFVDGRLLHAAPDCDNGSFVIRHHCAVCGICIHNQSYENDAILVYEDRVRWDGSRFESEHLICSVGCLAEAKLKLAKSISLTA